MRTLVILALISGWAAPALGAEAPGKPARVPGKPAAQSAKPAVHVYVPRARMLKDGAMTLASLCIIRCGDADLRDRARAVTMGRAPQAGETLVIDRATILSRLAAAGIKGDAVAVSGAPALALSNDASTFSTDQILAAARAYLDEQRPGAAGCGYLLVRKVEHLSVATRDKATLTVRTVPGAPAGYVKLEAAATAGPRTLGAAAMLFKITYPHRQAVATQAISAGTVFTAHNVRIRTVNLDQPAERDWQPPYGTEATRNIAPGVVVAASMTRTHKLEIVVRRKQAVTMIVRGAGFLVQGKGEALQDGRPGDMIKVRNNSSSRIVKATVQYDGTVVPTMEIN